MKPWRTGHSRIQTDGFLQPSENTKGTLIVVFSYLIDNCGEDGAKIFSEIHTSYEDERHQIQCVMKEVSNRCKRRIIQKKSEHMLELVVQRSCRMHFLEDILNMNR